MKVLQPQLKQADYLRTAWAVTPPAGTALKDVLSPESWAHVAAVLRPRDVIEIMPEDSEWYSLLIVRSISANGPVLAVPSHLAEMVARAAAQLAAEEARVPAPRLMPDEPPPAYGRLDVVLPAYDPRRDV